MRHLWFQICLCFFWTIFCILTNSRMLISNITIVFQIYGPIYPNKAFLIQFFVDDIACCLCGWYRMVSSGLLVKQLHEFHNIQNSYFFTVLINASDWLWSFDFVIQIKTARKILFLFCLISYTVISCTLIYVRKYHFLREIKN